VPSGASETPSVSTASTSPSPAEQEIRAAAAAIVTAFGHSDRAAYFALFAPDATFIFHTSPRRLNSRAEYEAEWNRWETEDHFKVLSCTSSDQRVQLLGDTAIFTHSVRTDLSTKQGRSTLLERETIVFNRRGGRWLGVHEHLSPEP
jgi:uncharacterized protein (TIGR02246 family)